MDIIELERWKPSTKDPRKLEYAGQPTAQEVFEELMYRLESMGYLPDEYFLMDSHWENDREIPKGADIFCTTDYGGSEGIYLDVYLKWFEDGKPITKSFLTGKTLGENGNDLDRMFLISSAITKAFHGDNSTHDRYMKIGCVEEDTGGRVIHLSQREEKVLMDALVEQRERQESAMSQTEQLLRRMTGSITAYMDLTGQRPLRISNYDRTVLAIRDGELSAFKDLYPKVLEEYADNLLMEAAGRPGAIGRKMTLLLLADVNQFSETAYHAACEKAIDIADPERMYFLLEQADSHVEDLSPSLYGEMAGHAYSNHRALSREMIKRGTGEQIAAAPPYLLELFASGPDDQILEELIEKGISSKGSAMRTLHMLTYENRHSRLAEHLLEKRMWVDPHDLSTLHACVQNDAVEVCKRLLDGGMDFESYYQWNPGTDHPETVQALSDYWAEIHAKMDQVPSQEQESGGQTFG